MAFSYVKSTQYIYIVYVLYILYILYKVYICNMCVCSCMHVYCKEWGELEKLNMRL